MVILIVPLIVAWILDLLLGDPRCLPHPVVGFGKCISWCEHRFNSGSHRRIKGAIAACLLIVGVFDMTLLLLWLMRDNLWLSMIFRTTMIFFCLAGRTLRREVKGVFQAVDRSLEEGRRQLSRIVGRDTENLSAQEIRTAALETLAENLSDGVIAPLFWYAVLGLPGMITYKMINTLDSMIAYRSERYLEFGCVAARIDDIANWIPARITAALMILSSGRLNLFAFVARYGSEHASPNSGYPEAALAGILQCRFGGTHDYFGQPVYKPYIGHVHKNLTYSDLRKALIVCTSTEILGLLLTVTVLILVSHYTYF